jgi:hypothetical protein
MDLPGPQDLDALEERLPKELAPGAFRLVPEAQGRLSLTFDPGQDVGVRAGCLRPEASDDCGPQVGVGRDAAEGSPGDVLEEIGAVTQTWNS